MILAQHRLHSIKAIYFYVRLDTELPVCVQVTSASCPETTQLIVTLYKLLTGEPEGTRFPK